MIQPYGPYMHVPLKEWEQIQARLEFLEKFIAFPDDADAGEADAKVFIRFFDTRRYWDWGHIAYCLEQVMNARYLRILDANK